MQLKSLQSRIFVMWLKKSNRKGKCLMPVFPLGIFLGMMLVLTGFLFGCWVAFLICQSIENTSFKSKKSVRRKKQPVHKKKKRLCFLQKNTSIVKKMSLCVSGCKKRHLLCRKHIQKIAWMSFEKVESSKTKPTII